MKSAFPLKAWAGAVVVALISTVLAWSVWERQPLSPWLVLGCGGVVAGKLRSGNPVLWAAGFAAMSVPAVVVVLWVRTLLLYLRFGNHQPFMEDGPIAELVIYPVVYLMIYIPFAAGVGAIAGLSVVFINAAARLFHQKFARLLRV